jgi:hypothetical protein
MTRRRDGRLWFGIAGLVAILSACGGQRTTGAQGSASNRIVSYMAGLYPRGIAAADLNGDGKPDLAVADTGSPTGPGGSPVVGSVSVMLTMCP